MIAVLFAVCLSMSFFLLKSSPLHLSRLEDRGKGITNLASNGPLLAGVGFFSHSAWLKDFRTSKAPDAWNTGSASHSVLIQGASGLIALPYLDERIELLKAGSTEAQSAWIHTGASGPIVVSGAAQTGDSLFIAAYEMNNDGSIKKTFPYFIPIQLRFRYRIMKASRLKPGRDNRVALFAYGTAEWHEESFHPWKIAGEPRNGRLFVLNTMAEQLLAYDLATGVELFRRDVPSGPVDMAVSAEDVFVACPESNRVFVYEAKTGKQRLGIDTGHGVVSLAWVEGRLFGVSKYRRLVFSAKRNGSVWETAEKAFAGVPSSLAFSGRELFIADGIDGRIARVDPDSLNILSFADDPKKL